jgi:molybdopterin molybdotransferase
VIAVDRALALLSEACRRGPEEEVSLEEALGRVLAREVRSDVDWPPFDTSAMDGYAVGGGDLGRTRLVERGGLVGAGDPPPAPLKEGETVRVMTGAPLPGGTHAIVPVEQTARRDGFVEIEPPRAAGAHIRRRGESVRAGTTLLSPGRRLSPSDVALAALAGADPIGVIRRPRVTIAVTGNELVAAARRPGPGQLRDSNGPMLASLCRARGIAAVRRPVVPDESQAVARLFRGAGDEEELLLTSGGVSAGDLDLLPEAAARAGFEILFHRVAVRPGKPIAFGRRDGVYWIGLPGNPVSASVAFHLFVRRALDLLEGASDPGPPRITARLVRELKLRGPRETYRDAMVRSEEGENRAEPLETAGSHDLAAHSRANALIRVPAESAPLPAGSIVTCVLLER